MTRDGETLAATLLADKLPDGWNVALIDGETHRFFHFWGDVTSKHFSFTPDRARGDINTTVQVFERGLGTHYPV